MISGVYKTNEGNTAHYYGGMYCYVLELDKAFEISMLAEFVRDFNNNDTNFKDECISSISSVEYGDVLEFIDNMSFYNEDSEIEEEDMQ